MIEVHLAVPLTPSGIVRKLSYGIGVDEMGISAHCPKNKLHAQRITPSF